MKKRVLSLFMVLVLCLTLLPTAAFAEGEDVSISGGVIGGGETGGEGGGIYVAPGSPTEGGGGTYIPGEDTRTEIWCVSKPDSIGRSYDGTTDGGTIPIDLTFTDGTNEIKLKEGTGFTAKKTFDSADAGWHKVTVEITLTGETAKKYKLKAGEETFTIGGYINKAYPNLTVTLSKTACTAGEKLLPLLSVEGAPEDAEVTYYYLASALKSWAGSSDVEGSEAMPKIDENTAISDPGTYYVYAKTAETTNYEEDRSATVELTVNEAVVEAASVTKADGTDGGTYESLPAALNAARDGDTVKLLANHVTDADALNALGEDFTFEQYASIVPVVTKTLTLDLNHKTVDYLEVGFTETNEETQKKETLATGNLTVTGEAAYGRISNLMFMAGALDIRSGEIGGSGCAGLLCDANSGSVTVSNGTVYGLTVLEGASVTVNGGSNHAGEWVVASSATLNITDGTFGDVQFTHNGTIAISGGTFQSIKSYIAEELQPLMSLLDTQKVHAFYKGDDVQDGNATELADVTVKEHTHAMVNNKCACGLSCTHTNTEGASTIGKDGKCTVCGTQFAAGIGEIYYTDVPSALNAAADDQTVKLLANEMLPDGIYVSKTLTLDLDGHSLDGYSLNVGGLTPTSQVRTGNLTVIDSSGGNGAVGVTVRDGGTLVFDPENDHTTLLQLEVWGGTVKLYGGKISRSGLRLNNNITLGDLLPGNAGLAYYRGDTQLTLEEAASKTCDLVVKLCSHGGKNGFDKNAATCPNCNAPAVAETALNNGPWRRFADLQTALDADRDGGAELTLLADVTGDYTIDGTQDTGIDLNGYSIHGTVDVKAVAEGTNNTTTFSNSKDTGSIKTVVAHRGANLAGSGAPAVIGTLEIADTTMWKNLLKEPDRVGFKVRNEDSTHKWYAASECKEAALYNVTIESLPITFKTLYLKVDGKNLTGNSPKVERGTTVQLCAGCNAKGADVYIYTGEIVGNNVPTYSQKKAEYKQIGTNWYYVVDLPCNTIGKYSVYFTATKDGYTVQSAEKKLTVTKPNLSNAEITFPYGNEAAFNSVSATGVPTFVVTYKGQTLEKDKDFTITGGGSTYDVGPCTLTIKATDNGDYTGSKSAEWTVRPLKVAASVGDIIKTYDGTTDLPANAKITLKSADSYYTGVPLRLAKGTDYEVLNACYDSADAGIKTVSFTIKLKNAGYVFEDGTTQKDFTLNGADFDDKAFQINKATVPMNNPTGTLNIINGTQQTYTYDFSKLLPEAPNGDYGTVRYDLGNRQTAINFTAHGYYLDPEIAEFEGSKLTLVGLYAKDGTATGQIGTVKVTVTTTNYENFQLKLVLNAVDQIKPEPDGTITATPITYGDTLSKSEILGTMKDPNTSATVDGTFTWTDGTIKPDAGSYDAEWTFTPAEGYEEYATATGTVTVKVKPAKLIVSVKASSMYYTGEEQIASIIASGQSVDSTPVTFTYSDKVDGNYTSGVPTFTDAGTYTAYYKAEAANHEPATGTFTVTIDPLPISLLSVSSISKTYDGSADVTLTADKLTFFSKTAKATNIKLPDTALTFSDAQFTSKQEDGSYLPSPEVGNGKALSFTMTLTSNNYVFEGKSEGTTKVSDVFATDDVNRFTITKAAAPTMQPIELTVINGLAKTYLVNLPALPTLGDNCKYGSIKYEACNFNLIGEGGYANSTAMITSNDEFQLTVPAVESQTEGSVGTVGVKITTDNYQDMLLTVEVIAKNKIVPVLDGEITATPITFGQILRVSTITGTMKDDGNTVEGTFEWTNPSTKPDKAGDYQAEWTFTPAAGYEKYATVTGTVTIKVNKATIPANAITAPAANALTYNGNDQALITAGMTDHGTMQYSLTENGTYSQDIPTATDAGAYTVWYRVIGDANHNDTAPASVAVRIGKKPLTITGVTAASKPYDGTTDAGITSVTFDGVNLNRDTDYNVTASFDDAGVDSGKNITATVTLMGQAAKNYALEQSSFTTTGSITKAAAPDSGLRPAVTVINDLAKTYEMVLFSDYLPKLSSPCEYGTVSYSLRGTYLTDGYKDTVQAEVVEENSQYKLKLTVPAVDYDKVSSVGTIDVRVTSDNYRDFYLTIGVKTKNKDVPVPDGTISASDITYGQALNDSKIAGKMKAGGKAIDGTFTWTNGTFKPAAGDYPASWTFTPAEGYEEYATATGTATVTVNPKAVTVSGITANGKVYDGTTNAVLDYSNAQFDGILENDKLTVAAKGVFEKAEAGKQNVAISDLTLVGNSANNYVLAESGNQTETTATITAKEVIVTITPNGGTYGSVTAAAAKLSGAVEGDNVPVTLTYTGNGYNSTAVPTNAGSYTVTASIADSNYVLTGETTANFVIEPKSIKDAKVVLGKGLIANGAEQTQTVEKVLLDGKELPADSYTVTDNTATAPGSHTLTITAKGNYTGTVKQTYVIVPAKAEDAPDKEITIGNGKVKVDIKFEGTVPPASQPTDKAELLSMLVDSGDITADELAQIADGASVDIVLTVKEANDPDAVKTAMAQAAKDYTIGQYLDISLLKYMTVNGSQQAAVALPTTKDALTISVVVPDALIKTNSAVNRTYCIVRRHDGAITVLDAAFDAASKTLTFKTDRFSDYAIAYKDTAVPSSGSNPGSNNSSNDSETKKNEVAAPTPAPTPASTSKPSTITAMPQTGDTSNPTLYVVLLVASLLGLAVVFVCKKRNDK